MIEEIQGRQILRKTGKVLKKYLANNSQIQGEYKENTCEIQIICKKNPGKIHHQSFDYLPIPRKRMAG